MNTTMKNKRLAACALTMALLVLTSAAVFAVDSPAIVTRTAAFDRDPNWDSFNNHIAPQALKKVAQDFGYSSTHFAAKAPGEIGGVIERASEPAWYGAKIAPRTLDDKLSASGTFALTKTGKGGIVFGWFNGNQPEGMGRPVNSLGIELSSTSAGGRLAVRLITDQNQSCGTFVTRFERYRTQEQKAEMRPTPIKGDGTRYRWKLDYDPAASGGKGQFQFTVKSDGAEPGDFEGKVFTVDLPEGFKGQGTNFDHFGLVNITRPGGALAAYFGDLELDGKLQDLSQDPNWDGLRNRSSYESKESPGSHDFGFSPTNHAGGALGEIGGLIWRAPYAYYATPVGPLSLKDRLEAHGRFVLLSGAPDSAVSLGWFNSSVKQVDDEAPMKGRNFIGVGIGGPTRIGHYFLPECTTVADGHGIPKTGPVIKRGQPYEWTLLYDPLANSGRGQMQVTLGKESITYDLRAGMKSDEAVFDRFGIFCVGTGGSQLKVYFDDLSYTSGKP